MRRGKYIAKRRFRRLMRIMHRPKGINVKQAAKRVGISLTTYYKWRKRASSMPDPVTALRDRRPSGPLHYKSLKPYQEEAILKVISEHPEYGCKKITEHLPKKSDGNPLVSSGGVQKFLERRRLNLNIYRFRFRRNVLSVYAKAERQTSLPIRAQDYKVEKEKVVCGVMHILR